VGTSSPFSAEEYIGLGVRINDSDPAPNSTFVNLINPVNIGTAISGYYVNVGAFASQPATFVELQLLSAVDSVSFDFATPSGSLSVEAFGAGGGSLGVFTFSGSSIFVNPAGRCGQPQRAGYP
jgi:hypothetical protein